MHERIGNTACTNYLESLKKGEFKIDSEGCYCILEGYPNWLRIYFPEQEIPPHEKLLDEAIHVIKILPELDKRANQSEESENYKPYLMNIYLTTEELELRYCSEIVNTEWGAYFIKNQANDWEFEELG